MFKSKKKKDKKKHGAGKNAVASFDFAKPHAKFEFSDVPATTNPTKTGRRDYLSISIIPEEEEPGSAKTPKYKFASVPATTKAGKTGRQDYFDISIIPEEEEEFLQPAVAPVVLETPRSAASSPSSPKPKPISKSRVQNASISPSISISSGEEQPEGLDNLPVTLLLNSKGNLTENAAIEARTPSPHALSHSYEKEIAFTSVRPTESFFDRRKRNPGYSVLSSIQNSISLLGSETRSEQAVSSWNPLSSLHFPRYYESPVFPKATESYKNHKTRYQHYPELSEDSLEGQRIKRRQTIRKADAITKPGAQPFRSKQPSLEAPFKSLDQNLALEFSGKPQADMSRMEAFMYIIGSRGQLARCFFMGKTIEEMDYVFKQYDTTKNLGSSASEIFANNLIRLMGANITAPESRHITESEFNNLKTIKKSGVPMSAPLKLANNFERQRESSLFMTRAEGSSLDQLDSDEVFSSPMSMRTLGELAAFDLLLGNHDRFYGNVNHGNIMLDPYIGDITAIDQTLSLAGMDIFAKKLAENKETHNPMMYVQQVNKDLQKNTPDTFAKWPSRLIELQGIFFVLFKTLLSSFLQESPHSFTDQIIIKALGAGNEFLSENSKKNMLIGIAQGILLLYEGRHQKESLAKLRLGIHPLELQAFFANWDMLVKAVEVVGVESIKQKLEEYRVSTY
ncbi:MAG: hypothetical protein MI784_16300 [Cytophagales bacterium]|nr:hypothetical protein [Cytophagales bacterium]